MADPLFVSLMIERLFLMDHAITCASQDTDSYERMTALEGIGWQVATMPAAQWKEING